MIAPTESGIVARDCTVQLQHRRYWAPDLVKYIGWEVLVEPDGGDEIFASVWSKGRMHRLCTAALVEKDRLADLDEARAAAADWAEHRRKMRASIVRGQAGNNPQLIKKCPHCGGDIGLSIVGKFIANCRRLLKGVRGNPNRTATQHSDEGEKNGTYRVQSGFEVNGHDGHSASLNGCNATPPTTTAESKKGGGK